MIRNLIKRFFYPGFDLHTRSRYYWLPKYFERICETLDVGCGNGALCYAAFKLGNNVLGVNYSAEEVKRNENYFRSFVLPERLKFSVFNAYDLPKLDKTFDQIICSETLEHIKNDKLIVGYFSQLLNPGGILHLCCPFSEHKVHKLGRTDVPEDGGHVRDGYTIETYAALLEGQGFKIIDSMGLGTPSLVMCDSFLRGIRNRFGDVFAVPFFLLMWPFLTFIDKPVINVPFSLYVKAVKI